jgi:hypothetical protein
MFKILWNIVTDTVIPKIIATIFIFSIIITILNVALFPLIAFLYFKIHVSIFTISLLVLLSIISINSLLCMFGFFKDLLLVNQNPIEIIIGAWSNSIGYKQKAIIINHIFCSIFIIIIILLISILIPQLMLSALI